MTDDSLLDPARHGFLEDAMAIITGTLLCALGVEFFRHAHLGTGGTAGLAFLVHYVSGYPIGNVLFVLNLPFYVFAWLAMGREFTLKTFAAVALFAGEGLVMPHVFAINLAVPLFATIVGGILVGVGLLILLRHKASLGGIGVLAAFVQQKLGWRAGKFQMACDLLIVAAAFLVLSWQDVALSVLGAVVLNLILAVNHKPGRYNGY